ncbi:hypothetical protein QN277_002623 [Acacia crassicarpa]|uniref:Uncharacterized protein n=1 Tax=Acacia crassicarpa TaxID=499986 RepID=A0AAE1N9R0_9FABA|nr:hypothetical protein QN277_002623 [Acacia crassicarpa]
MQQGDQTVISLRPGGGRPGDSRFLAPRFDSSSLAFSASSAFGSFASDPSLLRGSGFSFFLAGFIILCSS